MPNGARFKTPGPTRRLPEFLEHLPTHSADAPPWPWLTEHYFEWHVWQDSAREQPKGEWIIGAGVTFPLAAAPSASSSVVHAAATLGFEYGRVGTWVFLCRYMTLDQLAAWGTQHEQARRLADRLVEAFQALESLRSQAEASQS